MTNDTRHNILILGHDYTTQFVDIFNQYTKLFDEGKYAVTVAYLTGKPNAEIRKRTLAKQILFLNFSKKDIRNLKIKPIKKLLNLTKEKKFYMVFCHRYKPSYIMLWVARFYKIPHTFCIMHELGTMSHLSRKLLLALLPKKNLTFAGVSNAVRDDMRKSLWFVPKKQIITLYNMIDIDLVEPQLLSRQEARSALGIADNVFAFGNLARLAPNKDHTTLIQAFASLQSKKDCKNAKLYILGDGKLAAYDSYLKNMAKSSAQQNVIFCGFVPCAYRYLKAFDCFVLSSVQEAFGRVLIEAMVAKIPIIATHVHGIPEVVGNVGELVPPKQIDLLAQAMQKIYFSSAEERAKLGELGFTRARDYFSIPQFYAQFWGMFEGNENRLRPAVDKSAE